MDFYKDYMQCYHIKSYDYEPLEISIDHENIIKNRNINYTFTIPGHLTPLLGVFYFQNLPDNNLFKNHYKKIKLEFGWFMENIEEKDIVDFFSLFDSKRNIVNIEKLVTNYEKYEKIFYGLNLKNCDQYKNYRIYNFIPPGDYKCYAHLFSDKTVAKLPKYIQYVFGFRKRKDHDFFYEISNIKHNIEWFEYFTDTLKMKLDFEEYLIEFRKENLFYLNKYTYENENSGLEDPIFIKYVDKYIKKNTEKKLDVFLLKYLSYKEYKYLKSNGFTIDYTSINKIECFSGSGFVEIFYGILYYEEEIYNKNLLNFSIEIYYNKVELFGTRPNGRKSEIIYPFYWKYSLMFLDKVYEQIGHDNMYKLLINSGNMHIHNFGFNFLSLGTDRCIWIFDRYEELKNKIFEYLNFDVNKFIKTNTYEFVVIETPPHLQMYYSGKIVNSNMRFNNIVIRHLNRIFSSIIKMYELNLYKKEYILNTYIIENYENSGFNENELYVELDPLKSCIIQLMNLLSKNKDDYERDFMFTVVNELKILVENINWEEDFDYIYILNINNKLHNICIFKIC